ncbi:hypothetical protein SBV1_1300010 [Verrucomicrobia bacterium]|nr:hypothetical protein SBV1_1300010 [Verrucomicrobiota bacterium]
MNNFLCDSSPTIRIRTNEGVPQGKVCRLVTIKHCGLDPGS